MSRIVGEVVVLKPEQAYEGFPFWFEAQVKQMNKNGRAEYHTKAGSIKAFNPLQALDKVHDLCVTEWDADMLRVKVCEVDAQGEIVASTEYGSDGKEIDGPKPPSKALVEHKSPSKPPVTYNSNLGAQPWKFGTYMPTQKTNYPTMKFK